MRLMCEVGRWTTLAILLGATSVLAPHTTCAAEPMREKLETVLPKMECSQLDFKAQELSVIAGVPIQISSAKIQLGNGAPYCDVEGYVSPRVGFEVRLPTTRWTQRFLQTGCGGLCGVITIRVPSPQNQNNELVKRGEFVLAATNDGHDTNDYFDGVWAASDPQLRIDFAYRGVHVTALAAKALMQLFYGQKPRYSYFMGTSEGGREAAMETQRYPEDFNGLTSGAPAINLVTQITFYHAWNMISNSDEHNQEILTPKQLTLLHDGALAACDGKDGLKDGIISDPIQCQFDPNVLRCEAGQDQRTCLTSAQVAAAAKIYSGARDSTGHRLVISGPFPGSELQWAEYVPDDPDMTHSQSYAFATTGVKYLASTTTLPVGFSVKDFNFTEANFDSFQQAHAIYDALDPDLSIFARKGGKIIFWHGWADGSISPTNSIVYYNAIRKTMGEEKVQDFARLYLFPGGYHANAGAHPIVSDLLTPLMDWVESGVHPDRIRATYYADPLPKPWSEVPDTNRAIRTRPVFPYPQVATYRGEGNPDDPENFAPGKSESLERFTTDWIGERKFFTPHYELWCESSGMQFHCDK